jgi:hypothetical protein
MDGEEDDNVTVDAVINALYVSMSFLPGDQPDWDRFQKLFAHHAVFIPPASSTEGTLETMNLSSFVQQAKSSLLASGIIKKGNTISSRKAVFCLHFILRVEFMCRIFGG